MTAIEILDHKRRLHSRIEEFFNSFDRGTCRHPDDLARHLRGLAFEAEILAERFQSFEKRIKVY